MARQSFESGIIKINAKGEEVFSTYLDDGETLRENNRVSSPVITDSADIVAAIDEGAETQATGEPVTGLENGGDQNKSSAAADDSIAERPLDTDNKDAWFSYAKTKGFEGARDDLTVKQLIEQFG